MFLSTIILCSASWRILHKTVTEQILQVSEEDTLRDYFIAGSGATNENGDIDAIVHFNGSETPPTATIKGNETFPEGVESIWQYGYYVNGEEITDTDHAGVYAGTHHYQIIDKSTGQVICYNHIVTITPDTLSVNIDGTPYKTPTTAEGATPSPIPVDLGKYFERETFSTGDVVWTADNSETSVTRDATSITVKAENYKADPISLPTFVPTGEHINANNYSNYESAKVAASYIILPKAKIGNTYYGSVTLALKAATNNTSANTVEALHAYSNGSTTYVASTDTNSASSGKFTHVIENEEITINSNDTLRIPIGIGKDDSIVVNGLSYTQQDDNTKDGLFLIYLQHDVGLYPDATIHSNAYFTSEWCKNAVTLKNTKITNAGIITIDAVVTGGAGGSPYSSIVFGDYAKLTLDSSSKITNSGTINCYGFIDEETPDYTYADNPTITDNTVQLDMQSGTLNTIFTIVEHRGGNVFMGMVNPTEQDLKDALNLGINREPTTTKTYSPTMTTFAFHRFFIQSVSVNTKVSASALIQCEVSLFANNGPNQAIIKFMGKASESPIFALTNSTSYATLKYTHNQTADLRKMDIDTYGNATINPLSLKLTVKATKTALGQTAYVTIYIDMKTTGCLLPISHYFDLSFNDDGSASTAVNMNNQEIKILPGGSVTIGENVTVTVPRIAVYKNNNLLNGWEKAEGITQTNPANSGTFSTYGIAQGTDYPDLDPGKLMIKGTLNVGSLGGTAIPGSNNAVLNITTSNAVISPEILQSYDTSITIDLTIASQTQPYCGSYFSTDSDSKLIATGDLWQSHSTNVSDSTLSIGQYYGRDSAWAKSQSIKITYVSNGGSAIDSAIFDTTNYDGLKLTDLPDTTREHYDFSGWFTNAALTASANGVTVYTDTTLYAKWTPKTYNIKYQYVFDGVDTKDLSNYSTSTFTVADNPVNFVDLSGANLGDGYNFVGWYKAEACATTDTITRIKGSDLITSCAKDSDGYYIVYGKWAAQTYKFEYALGNEGAQSELAGQISANFTDIEDTLPDDNEYDTQYKYYLTGWQLIDSDGNAVTDANGDNVIYDPGVAISNVVTVGDSGPYRLKALWETKYTLYITGSNGSDDYPISFNQTVYLLEDQISSTFTSYDNAVKYYNEDTAVDAYFKNWIDENGTPIESLTKDNFVDGTLALTATFDAKYSLRVTGQSGSTIQNIDLDGFFAQQNGDKPWYLLDSQLEEYFNKCNTEVIKYDTNTTVEKYFTGWTNGNGSAITSLTESSFDSNKSLTLTGTWGTKHTVHLTALKESCSNSCCSFTLTAKGTISDNAATITMSSSRKDVYFLPTETATLSINITAKGTDGLWILVQISAPTLHTVTATVDDEAWVSASGTAGSRAKAQATTNSGTKTLTNPAAGETTTIELTLSH